MKFLKSFALLFFCFSGLSLNAQQVIPLYNGQIPGNLSCGVTERVPVKGEVAGVTVPTLTVFVAEKTDPLKGAVLIIPGGGYDHLAMTHEGFDVAKAYNAKGITAFVLKYRLPSESQCFADKKLVPLMDAQQAMVIIRSRAKEWNIDPQNVGVNGFSAGGHLAATLLTRYNMNLTADKNANLKPNWGVLGYPVISMADSLGKSGTKKNLIGMEASATEKEYFSAERHVDAATPFCFIFQAQDDRTVSVQHSLLFYQALLKNKVPSELHIFPKGGHGFGLHNKSTSESWFEQMIQWLLSNQCITKS
ncbi:alpha/beta hydrolase [Pedobacter nutrimenti]|uniref:Acetyl esterase/lipase n=1 Tax=Pedobacter nutrimenti TaxID=1241337 RepID=A0A318UI28_9SPHI|nr:alpha/beta hydrolase [Pedobacter nutrimenti]PYF75200.1 acetyl esterase/lipase [Pedobacter nutrimenti]